FAKAVADKFFQRAHHCGSIGALCADIDRAARAGGKHHQPHDRVAAHADTILLDGDVRIVFADKLDELCRRAGMQAPLVDDHHLLAELVFGHFPLTAWRATLTYFRPATCASCKAMAMSLPRRTRESLISIGKLTPAIT